MIGTAQRTPAQPSLRDRAASLELMLEAGIASVADVVAWADGVIASEPAPHWALCELSLMGTKRSADVVVALRDVPGVANPEVVAALIAHMLARILEADRSRADAVAWALWCLHGGTALRDPDLRRLSAWVRDGLFCADDGSIEQTRADLIDDMLATLRKAAGATVNSSQEPR
jgi:hypothetical protein